MEQPTDLEYVRQLEKLIQQVLIPGYLELANKYDAPFPWNKIPAHLVAGSKQPKQVARLLQAAFRV